MRFISPSSLNRKMPELWSKYLQYPVRMCRCHQLLNSEEIQQICLIDTAYASPDDVTLLVLQTFADWQAQRHTVDPFTR